MNCMELMAPRKKTVGTSKWQSKWAILLLFLCWFPQVISMGFCVGFRGTPPSELHGNNCWNNRWLQVELDFEKKRPQAGWRVSLKAQRKHCQLLNLHEISSWKIDSPKSLFAHHEAPGYWSSEMVCIAPAVDVSKSFFYKGRFQKRCHLNTIHMCVTGERSHMLSDQGGFIDVHTCNVTQNFTCIL